MNQPLIDLKNSFELYDSSIKQEIIQSYLRKVHLHSGLKETLNQLYKWEMKTGYISLEKITNKKTFYYPDKDYQIVFRAQVNYARDGYTPNPQMLEKMKELHCPICIENIGIPGKENLRVYEFQLNKNDFFIQLTPFPLFDKHFVLVSLDKIPMKMNADSVSDLAEFVEMIPSFTGCSNSDVEWAGSSILKHHHYQLFNDLRLPVMEAGFIKGFSGSLGDFHYGILHYPLAVCKCFSSSKISLIHAMGNIIANWKSIEPGKNTCNLIVAKNQEGFEGYILFRNPDYRTPEELTIIKKEGVGIIEVAGEGIYPVPKGDKADWIWNEIKDNGLSVIRSIISGNNPVKRKNYGELFKIIKESL